MRFLLALLLGIGFALSPAFAEIEKQARPGDDGLRLYWWPKLPALAGWHQDEEQSLRYAANALAPDGFTFANAEAVIYAKAIYKPRDPEMTSLAMMIDRDKRNAAAHAPGVIIEAAESLTTADGTNLPTYTFVPNGAGNWERVAYGDEGDFYLVFALSARSLDGYRTSMRAFERLIEHYKENLEPTTPTLNLPAALAPPSAPDGSDPASPTPSPSPSTPPR